MSSRNDTYSSPIAPNRTKPKAVSPIDETRSKRMTVEPGVVDELLLVCGVIGTTTEGSELVPVTDCLNWLQDLQRALRRDDDTFRPISLLLGKWKVVQQKLLPLVMTCRYDTSMVLTIVKILVILTKPMNEVAKRAGRHAIDTKKYPKESLKEFIELRENALAQSQMLMELKRAVVHHPSHNKSGSGKQGGLLSIFVSLLAEPISRTGSSRTDSDHLTIELVLRLFCHLLAAEPILKPSADLSQGSAQLHQELVCLFDTELVLEILLVIAQDMESRENQDYNLLMMELLNLLMKNQDPTAVARSIKQKSTSSVKYQDDGSGSLLRANLRKEKQKIRSKVTSRHANFGGTLMVKRSDGKRQYVGAALIGSPDQQQLVKKRKNRKRDAFIGSVRRMSSHTRGITSSSPMTLRAQRTINDFCSRFLESSYGPLMKSLKNEFRRDSVRLEDGDKTMYFRIIWFFCQWWRASRKTDLGHLIFTIDVFSFTLLTRAIDTYLQHKKYQSLAQAVALHSEMIHLLHFMYCSKDPTENIMALGLMDTLYYGAEPIDRLPKLLSKWAPSTMSRDYLCDLVEIVHMTLKLLEMNTLSCSEEADSKEKNEDKQRDIVIRMKMNAADFDVTAFVARKIVSNKVVRMYTHLISQYSVNSAIVNHRVIAFFLRISKIEVAASDDINPDEPRNLLSPKAVVTLKPMLYNINLLMELEKILNDASIRKSKEYSQMISFATQLTSSFAEAAVENPLLYVECLFCHPLPHRFCDLLTNNYVDEELRMIAERELLLEEQRLTMKQAYNSASEAEEELSSDKRGDKIETHEFQRGIREESKENTSDETSDVELEIEAKLVDSTVNYKNDVKMHSLDKENVGMKISNKDDSNDTSDEEFTLESNKTPKKISPMIWDSDDDEESPALIDSEDKSVGLAKGSRVSSTDDLEPQKTDELSNKESTLHPQEEKPKEFSMKRNFDEGDLYSSFFGKKS